MKRLLLGAALAFGTATAANAWTCTSPILGYKVTASMVPAPHGNRSLRLAVASDQGITPAMKLHAYFIDEDGLILGEAPLSQPRADGAMLVATDPGAKVPGSAASLVVIGQPDDAAQKSIATQFTLPKDD